MCLAVRIVALLAVVLMTGCVSKPRTIEVSDMPMSVWASPEDIFYDNSDTLQRRELSILLRYDKGYHSDSIPMRILTISPDSLVLEESFTLRVPHLADMRPQEQIFSYRRNVVLLRQGRYHFRLTPEEPVEGIRSVGLIISQPENNTVNN